MHRALGLVGGVLPGATGASLTRLRADRPTAVTVAASGPLALAADRIQYATGQGPCLAAAGDDVAVTSDFTTETRWPRFTARVTSETPLRAAVSHPLGDAGSTRTSLNVYFSDPSVPADRAAPAVALAAATVGLAVTAAEQFHRADGLARAVVSNRAIGAAVGIVMHERRITEAEAFGLLRDISQRTNRKLRAVADEVVLTGTLPLPDPGALSP